MSQKNANDFLKVPKALFRDARYNDVPALAKLLYAFLLDRTSLSKANGKAWQDDVGNSFVYFPIKEIMERFGCGHDKAAALLKDLERAKLIRKTLKGRGKPCQIVVWPIYPADADTLKDNCSEIGDSDANKTDFNYTESNNTDSVSMWQRDNVMHIIKHNIGYQSLQGTVSENLLEGILNVIVDTICTPTPSVHIAGQTVPREEVRRRFLALENMDVVYVCDKIASETQDIRSLPKYILARLYEAKHFVDTYYDNWRKRDG